MAAFPTEDRLRQKRTKSEQAISLAMKNRWEEAAQVNREILEIFPNEVDAFNRLGKALTGGFPLSACVGRADVMDAAWPASQGEAIHTSTYLGHPVGCAILHRC